MSAPVHVDEVGHLYGRSPALCEVSFSLTPGVTALVGVNGAGKSTLLRILAGAQRPTQGRVGLIGLDPYHFRSRTKALQRVALMPQGSELPRGLTASEVVASLAWLNGLTGSLARSRATWALGLVGLAGQVDTRMSRLSGGMVRRVALAQALATRPEVLLLDEPSTGLDPEQRRSMMEVIHTLSSTVVLFSSHVMEDVEDIADRVLVLEGGRVALDGSIEEVRTLGRSVMGPGSAGSWAEAGFLETLRRVRARKVS